MDDEEILTLQDFNEITSAHVPPKVKNIIEEEVCLRVPLPYRIRVRGSDMQYEVVGRFTGFTVPAADDPEVLILEFVPEHSFKTENEWGQNGE